jgi:hypothetical protein
MFVKLLYRYRRFGSVDAGQGLSEGNITVVREWESQQLSSPSIMGFLPLAE